MGKRKGGSRAGTRQLFKKKVRQRGKISLTKYFMPYSVGEKAVLVAEPAMQKSLYHQRFHGKVGTVKAQRGRCYILDVRDGGKIKTIIVHPVHLKKA